MDLKHYLALKSPAERDQFAALCGTTRGHLQNVMYGVRSCATDLAVAIEIQSHGRVTRQELRDDWRRHWPELANSEFPTSAL